MSDPTIPDVASRKKLMFYDSDHRQAALKIRCQYDGITQSQFFRMMITGYIESDSDIVSYIDSFKERNKIQGKKKRAYIEKMHSQRSETEKKFSLNEKEIQNIYDILEEEGASV